MLLVHLRVPRRRPMPLGAPPRRHRCQRVLRGATLPIGPSSLFRTACLRLIPESRQPAAPPPPQNSYGQRNNYSTFGNFIPQSGYAGYFASSF